MKGIVIRFTDRDFRYIKKQAKRSLVSVEDFVVIAAKWHANEVRKQRKPPRMPPVMPGD